MIFDLYVALVRVGEDDETPVPVTMVADRLGVPHKDFIEDLLFEKDYTGVCVCDFEDPENPTLDEIDACPCVPELVPKQDFPYEIRDEAIYMTACDLSSALLAMENDIGEDLRLEVSELMVNVIQEATGLDEEQQLDTLDTALAHCTEDDETPLTTLLDGTLERIRQHFSDQNP